MPWLNLCSEWLSQGMHSNHCKLAQALHGCSWLLTTLKKLNVHSSCGCRPMPPCGHLGQANLTESEKGMLLMFSTAFIMSNGLFTSRPHTLMLVNAEVSLHEDFSDGIFGLLGDYPAARV